MVIPEVPFSQLTNSAMVIKERVCLSAHRCLFMEACLYVRCMYMYVCAQTCSLCHQSNFSTRVQNLILLSILL